MLTAENGKFFLFTFDDLSSCAGLATGTLTANGTAISGSIKAALVNYSIIPGIDTSCTYQDGSLTATGTLSGTIAERSTLTATATGQTALGTSLGSATYAGQFDSLYNYDSSLATIAGNWTTLEGIVFNINSNGEVFAQDPDTGCVVNGQISVIDLNYNAYSVSVTYSNCDAWASAANGVTGTGLAMIDNTVVPNQLITGYSATLANGQFVAVLGLAER